MVQRVRQRAEQKPPINRPISAWAECVWYLHDKPDGFDSETTFTEDCENVAKHAPESIVIVVSNPLDAMEYTAWKVTGFPTNRIVGQAGCLDVARYRAFIAMELGVSVEDVSALLLGGHGDDMVPLPRYTSVHGIPVMQLLPKDKIDACVERAKVGGGETVKLMGTSAYYAPASGTIKAINFSSGDSVAKGDVLCVIG